jgi:hypothetical protein
VSKVIVVETQKQHAGVKVIQSFNACITTTRMEIVVVPNINVVRKGVLIKSVSKLGNGSCGVLANQSLALPTVTTKVVGTLQMVFTNPIITTHVNKTANQPLMSLMVAKRYRTAGVTNPKGGY